MAKILIHVHVYYVKSWYKIEKCLKKIMADKSNEVKILTTVSAVIDDSDLYKIEKTGIPNMSLIRVPNDGYDIQPFFLLLKSVSLEQYDYLIKLHTKNDVYGIDVKSNGRYISRAQWSNFLMDAIASTPKAFKENINKMQADPAIGMIGSSYFISKVSSSDEEEKRLIADFAHKLGADKISESQYVAGTMFIVRTSILKPLIASGMVNEEFEHSESRKLGGTKAHAIERILGILVTLSKKTIVGYDKSLWKDLITSSLAHALRRFTFDKRITSNGRVLVRICRIPVCNFKYSKS
jgi:lipopolysaccharide biosynthesis protein